MSVVPSQILYLEHGSSRLYAEAIQIVETRCLCWARPTLLIQGLTTNPGLPTRQDMIAAAAHDPDHSALELYDLNDCPDLIWPIELFHIACDIDFFSLLVQLKMYPNEIAQRKGHEQLTGFIHSFWHTHPDAFHPAPSKLPSPEVRQLLRK